MSLVQRLKYSARVQTIETYVNRPIYQSSSHSYNSSFYHKVALELAHLHTGG